MKNTTNVFLKGMSSDFHPLATDSQSYTDALNATLLTYNGNEQMMQNDMGNTKIQDTKTGNIMGLREGFVPVGMKEYGGIMYIASANKDGVGEIGTIPSPVIEFDQKGKVEQKYPSFYFNESTLSNKVQLGETLLKPGEKFLVSLQDDKIINELSTVDEKKFYKVKLFAKTSSEEVDITDTVENNKASYVINGDYKEDDHWFLTQNVTGLDIEAMMAIDGTDKSENLSSKDDNKWHSFIHYPCIEQGYPLIALEKENIEKLWLPIGRELPVTVTTEAHCWNISGTASSDSIIPGTTITDIPLYTFTSDATDPLHRTSFLNNATITVSNTAFQGAAVIFYVQETTKDGSTTKTYIGDSDKKYYIEAFNSESISINMIDATKVVLFLQLLDTSNYYNVEYSIAPEFTSESPLVVKNNDTFTVARPTSAFTGLITLFTPLITIYGDSDSLYDSLDNVWNSTFRISCSSVTADFTDNNFKPLLCYNVYGDTEYTGTNTIDELKGGSMNCTFKDDKYKKNNITKIVLGVYVSCTGTTDSGTVTFKDLKVDTWGTDITISGSEGNYDGLEVIETIYDSRSNLDLNYIQTINLTAKGKLYWYKDIDKYWSNAGIGIFVYNKEDRLLNSCKIYKEKFDAELDTYTKTINFDFKKYGQKDIPASSIDHIWLQVYSTNSKQFGKYQFEYNITDTSIEKYETKTINPLLIKDATGYNVYLQELAYTTNSKVTVDQVQVTLTSRDNTFTSKKLDVTKVETVDDINYIRGINAPAESWDTAYALGSLNLGDSCNKWVNVTVNYYCNHDHCGSGNWNESPLGTYATKFNPYLLYKQSAGIVDCNWYSHNFNGTTDFMQYRDINKDANYVFNLSTPKSLSEADSCVSTQLATSPVQTGEIGTGKDNAWTAVAKNVANPFIFDFTPSFKSGKTNDLTSSSYFHQNVDMVITSAVSSYLDSIDLVIEFEGDQHNRGAGVRSSDPDAEMEVTVKVDFAGKQTTKTVSKNLENHTLGVLAWVFVGDLSRDELILHAKYSCKITAADLGLTTEIKSEQQRLSVTITGINTKYVRTYTPKNAYGNNTFRVTVTPVVTFVTSASTKEFTVLNATKSIVRPQMDFYCTRLKDNTTAEYAGSYIENGNYHICPINTSKNYINLRLYNAVEYTSDTNPSFILGGIDKYKIVTGTDYNLYNDYLPIKSWYLLRTADSSYTLTCTIGNKSLSGTALLIYMHSQELVKIVPSRSTVRSVGLWKIIQMEEVTAETPTENTIEPFTDGKYGIYLQSVVLYKEATSNARDYYVSKYGVIGDTTGDNADWYKTYSYTPIPAEGYQTSIKETFSATEQLDDDTQLQLRIVPDSAITTVTDRSWLMINNKQWAEQIQNEKFEYAELDIK